jgi:hypothetical protein
MQREVPIGAVSGTLWACGMRVWMVTLVGDQSTFSLRGTLFGLVLPSAVVGGLLGGRRGSAQARPASTGSDRQSSHPCARFLGPPGSDR